MCSSTYSFIGGVAKKQTAKLRHFLIIQSGILSTSSMKTLRQNNGVLLRNALSGRKQCRTKLIKGCLAIPRRNGEELDYVYENK
jgi:hypothetical protein